MDHLEYLDLFLENKEQEDTPEFKKWFAGSKVVDDKGNPLVVYHGTDTEFDTFDIKKMRSGWLSTGFYFSENEEDAKSFGSIIMPCYLKIKNPFIIQPDKINKDGSVTHSKSTKEQIFDKFPETKNINWKDVSQVLKNKGYDGIINSMNLIAVFNPKQIKSATKNSGKFNPSSSNIYEAKNEI